MLEVDHKALAPFVDLAMVPLELIDTWQERTGHNLGDSFASWEKVKATKRNVHLLLWGGLILTTIAITLLFLFVVALKHDRAPAIIIIGLLFTLFAATATWCERNRKKGWAAMGTYRDAVDWVFFTLFAKIVAWSEYRFYLKKSTASELQGFATRITLNAAINAVRLESELGIRGIKFDLSEQASCAQDDFLEKYDTFRKLGLITQPDGYKWFYKMAGRLLATNQRAEGVSH